MRLTLIRFPFFVAALALFAAPSFTQTRTWELVVEGEAQPIRSPSAVAALIKTEPGKREIRQIVCKKGPRPWAPPGVERASASFFL